MAAYYLSDITQIIERLELFEEKAGVRLEALSGSLQVAQSLGVNNLTIYGELHPREGTTLPRNVELVVTVYDSSGRVIGVQSRHFFQERFFGFEAFSMCVFNLIERPARVRVYPKSS